jgi:DNA-binding transcriptional MerR regulator
MNYIKPGELPNIKLYMDQVTTFMDEHLSDCKRRENDKILTKTMINNYTKNNLLPPPEKKKYSKEHLYLLTFIYYFKNILSISDIQTILEPLTDHFFSESETSLDDIYKCVYELCKSQIAGISQDVLDKAKLAADSYENLDESSDKDFLQLFALVSMLSFDVYMKKNIIESLIDDFASRNQPEPAESKKKKKE